MNQKEEPDEWLNAFNETIFQNISDSTLTNARIAKEMEISPRKLHRKVKAVTDTTPNLYIRNMRLEHAHELMQTGQVRTVKEAISESGFLKVSYFYQIFKEKYGYPPGEVLRINGWK